MALQMSWQQHHLRRKPPLGLKNLGNTCYLNSVLQCLSYTPPLAQFCLSSQHSSLCKTVAAGKEKECPFCILERQIARCLSLDGPLESPAKIQKCITVFAEHFRWGRQEDAHEFLRYVIDACHNTCLRIRKLVPRPAAPGHGASTVMKEIFGGALLSQVKCLSCKGESNKTDEIMDISLDLFQSNSLKDALARFFQPEVLDGANKYSCSNCKKLSVARKQMFILRAPNVLVIQLKRFEGINGGKINKSIDFEEVLVLSKFVCNSSQDPQPEYSLFGCIVHSGYSPDSGHYYAYIKDASGRWYCCNDAHVSLSSSQEVLSEKVYILFYSRSNQSPNCGKPGLAINGTKCSDSNGRIATPCRKSVEQKAVEILREPIKQNSSYSSKSNVSIMLKDGKALPSPQMKPIYMKNFDIKRVVANGNGNHKLDHTASVERSNAHGEEQTEKRNTTVPADSCTNELKADHKAEMPSTANANIANGSASSDMDTNKGRISLVTNGNGPLNQLNSGVCQENDTQTVAAGRGKLDCDHSSGDKIDACDSSISGSKRKSFDTEITDIPVLSTKKSCSLSRKDVSCQSQFHGDDKHSPELVKFEEVLAQIARSELLSSGWVDEVHAFMSTQKKISVERAGKHPDGSELRKQLISEAKKAFISHIPESLKEHLIESLRSFHQGKL